MNTTWVMPASSIANTAESQAQAFRFDIAAGDLDSALRTFAAQTRLQIARLTDANPALKSERVVGYYTATEALARLLRGTGYRFQFVNSQTVAIVDAHGVKSGEPGSNAPSKSTLPKLVAVVAMCVALPPGVACAQDSSTAADSAQALEEIVVTAERRSENLQKTPISIAVVSGDEVAQMGRSDLNGVLQNVPAVNVQGAVRGFMVAIRGLGNDLPPQNGQTSVSVNFDGLYNFRAESGTVGFYDLNQVEVLRGPQNTLYGRSASGGVVNVSSRNPALDKLEGYGTIELGNYGLVHTEGAVNLPFSDAFAWRTAFTSINRQGYLSNGQNDAVGHAVRSKLLYQPSADFSLLAATEYTRLGGKAVGAVPTANFSNGDAWTTPDTGLGSINYRSWKYWLEFNLNIGPGALFIQPSYQRASGKASAAFGGAALVGSQYLDTYDPKLATQTSAEVRYHSLADATVQWDVGYYHYDNKNITQTTSGPCQDPSGVVYFPPDGYSNQPLGSATGQSCVTPAYAFDDSLTIGRSSTDAGFGQVTYPVLPQLRLIGGLRYTRDSARRQVADPSLPVTVLNRPTVYNSQSDNHVDWRAGVEYDVTAASMLYATASTGYRAGGFNFNNAAFGPEKLLAYEVGWKNRLLNNRLQLNGDVFYYDYKDYQLVSVGYNASNAVAALFINLPTARDWGVEFEPQMLITPDDVLGLSYVYLNATLTSTLPNLIGNFDGAPLPHASRNSFKANYSHIFHLWDGATLTPRFDYRYQSEQFVAPVAVSGANQTAAAYMPGFSTGDVSLLYSAADNKWTLNAYVKNVNDKGIKNSSFPPLGWGTVDAPRTYGAVLSVHF